MILYVCCSCCCFSESTSTAALLQQYVQDSAALCFPMFFFFLHCLYRTAFPNVVSGNLTDWFDALLRQPWPRTAGSGFSLGAHLQCKIEVSSPENIDNLLLTSEYFQHEESVEETDDKPLPWDVTNTFNPRECRAYDTMISNIHWIMELDDFSVLPKAVLMHSGCNPWSSNQSV